jgi:chromosome segregation ATPase
MAEKKVTVNLDINTNIEPTIANLKQLKKQLKETAAGSEEFAKTSAAIRDLDDAIKDAAATSDDFAGYLENASGPLGQLGQGLRAAQKNFSSFNAVLKASVIGIIVAAIAGLAAAIGQSEKATKKLQPIMEGFEKILNGVFAAIEPLFDALIDIATKALPYVTEGFKVAYSAIASFLQGIGKVGEAIGKLIKGDFTGAWDSAKASVTEFGKRYEEANKRFEAGTKELTKKEKEQLEERNKNNAEALKKRQEAEKAAAEERKRIREAELKELLDGQKEAFLETLSEREQEEYKVVEHYQSLLALATKYGDDTTKIKEAQAVKLKEIDDKYKKEEKEKEEKAAEEQKKKREDFAKYMQENYENLKKMEAEREELTFKTNQAIDQSWVDLGQNISNIIGSVKGVFEEGSDAAKAFAIAQIVINAASSIGQILVNNQAAQFEYTKAIAAGNAAILSSIPKLVNPLTAPLGIAEAAAGKAAIAGAVAGKAALKVTTGLQIAAVGVSSATQIAAVLSAKSSGGGGGGASSGGGGGGGGTPVAAPTVGPTAIPQIQSGQGVNPTQQIGETIAKSQGTIRAYVVSKDIQNQSALDRRASRAATFNGG